MGYYTEYNLAVRNIKTEKEFKELSDYLKEKELIGYAFGEGMYIPNRYEATFCSYDTCKWYEHAEDMMHIAEKFPALYFELEGAGEEFGDFWREYYHDMDIEECRGEIVYEQPHKVQWKDLMPF